MSMPWTPTAQENRSSGGTCKRTVGAPPGDCRFSYNELMNFATPSHVHSMTFLPASSDGTALFLSA